ncbi:hypothetical protein EA571_20340, partial [Salmonella enterica subsp. enterica serovar Oranienburg]|nr:hypothetical protein [Salmonella enterica subsp. enterica serovar Oranienburg]
LPPFFLNFDIDAWCQKYLLIKNRTVLPSFQGNTVKINNGIDRIQWTVLSFGNLFHDGVGYL